MTLPRIYVEGNVSLGETVRLPEAAGHHTARVLRKNIGDELVIFNGEGGEYRCNINFIRKSQVDVTPLAFSDIERSPDLQIHLGLCVLKKDAMDNVVTKSTELGVSSITPVVSEHCAVAHKVIHARQAHWKQVAIAACEQCGLNRPPDVTEATELTDWLERQHSDVNLIAVPGSGSRIPGANSVSSVSLLIGPEGGFSQAEIDAAVESGFTKITLGERIMRAETFPVVALSVLHNLWGDFSQSAR